MECLCVSVHSPFGCLRVVVRPPFLPGALQQLSPWHVSGDITDLIHGSELNWRRSPRRLDSLRFWAHDRLKADHGGPVPVQHQRGENPEGQPHQGDRSDQQRPQADQRGCGEGLSRTDETSQKCESCFCMKLLNVNYKKLQRTQTGEYFTLLLKKSTNRPRTISVACAKIIFRSEGKENRYAERPRFILVTNTRQKDLHPSGKSCVLGLTLVWWLKINEEVWSAIGPVVCEFMTQEQSVDLPVSAVKQPLNPILNCDKSFIYNRGACWVKVNTS